jgi:F0F1-type ATP synthase assembly protein I
MEQEPPDKEIVADDVQSAEDRSVFTKNKSDEPARDQIDIIGGEYNPVLEEVWHDDPVFGETDLDIVDPYTASPAPAFPETSARQSISESAEDWADRQTVEDPFIPIPYVPATQNETIRRSGLAWSAGIAFFGSVVFTLFLGWIADLLLGSSPWGIVGGIILGSIIAFLQFFRITSQIFPRKDDGPKISPLMTKKDDE